ncbi:vacuolar protein sorting-associated protein 16 homolog, partial [Malurus melanocephalus]|uniref:vacuolar protein sorting-associated protein 16 homolog n=1 Tax=Malurus melanocephalus TaxID=175006 RepID=UPI002548E5E0
PTQTPPGLSPSAGPFLHMAVSFTHRHLALFSESGTVWMGMASLKEKFCEFSTGIRSPPKQMVWCTRPRSRQRAVVLAWDRQLMVVGNSSECIRYPLGKGNPPGAAATSSVTHTGVLGVPLASQEIFRIASMAPGALLLEAQKEYEKESQKADEYLREIREQQLLPEAVGQCIEAAGYEHEPETQKSLLRAASFGKCFLDKFPPEGFVRMCQDLRVLNAIRDYQIGIPLTFTQYKQLTIEVLLDSGPEGTQTGHPGVTPLSPAQLLEYEPRSGEQVPLLLKMKRSKLALGKAIESGDTDLGSHLGNDVSMCCVRAVSMPCPCHVRAVSQRIEGRVAALQNALDEFYKAKNDFAAKATEEQIKLLRLQRHLQEDLDKPYLDLSLHDTVSTLILDGHHKRAEQLYRDFKIPDKRYWWLKINALATRGDWEEMEKFSKSKKSPIGYLVRASPAGGQQPPLHCPSILFLPSPALPSSSFHPLPLLSNPAILFLPIPVLPSPSSPLQPSHPLSLHSHLTILFLPIPALLSCSSSLSPAILFLPSSSSPFQLSHPF